MEDTKTSYPRSKIKILLLENISDAAAAELEESGYAEKVAGEREEGAGAGWG